MEDAVFLHGGRLGHVIVPADFCPSFFVSSKNYVTFVAGWESWDPRNNVLETIETSGIETIQIYLESPGGALCNVLSYVFTRIIMF